MGILSGLQKDEPLHYGEVFTIWTTVAGNNGVIAGLQTFINHCGDEDLQKILADMIQTMQNENKQLETILKVNGIGLPIAPPERPHAKREEIPVGARFNDPEISASASLDIAASLVAFSKAMGMCSRDDLAMLYGQFHLNRAQLGAKLLRLNKEKGWLILPPLHIH